METEWESVSVSSWCHRSSLSYEGCHTRSRVIIIYSITSSSSKSSPLLSNHLWISQKENMVLSHARIRKITNKIYSLVLKTYVQDQNNLNSILCLFIHEKKTLQTVKEHTWLREKWDNPLALSVGMKLIQPLWRTVWRFLLKTRNKTSIWPSNPITGAYCQGIKTEK